MDIRTLEKVTQGEILSVFNASFSDYFVPFKLTIEQLDVMLKSDNYDPRLSAGAFYNDQLVGFILHGIDQFRGQLTAYNCGTGVLHEFRGSGITSAMYHFIIPKLREEGVEQSILEVIDRNTGAIGIYKKTGFEIVRELVCYKGKMKSSNEDPAPAGLDIRIADQPDWQRLKQFMDWEAAWQNADRTINALGNAVTTQIGYIDDNPVGYICHGRNSGRVLQFAVSRDYRRQGVATELFRAAASVSNEIGMINQDSSDPATEIFLLNIGIEAYLTQFEMILNINN